MLVSELPVSVQVRQGTSKPAFPNPSPPDEEASASEEWRVVVLYSPRVSSGSWRTTLNPTACSCRASQQVAPFHMMPIVGGQATPWSRMLRASQVGQHLPDAFQSQVNNAWHGRERSTSDNPRCQFNSRHGHTESCRECRTTPKPKFNPPWPHPTCQCKHAWPRRDLERSGLPICR